MIKKFSMLSIVLFIVLSITCQSYAIEGKKGITKYETYSFGKNIIYLNNVDAVEMSITLEEMARRAQGFSFAGASTTASGIYYPQVTVPMGVTMFVLKTKLMQYSRICRDSYYFNGVKIYTRYGFIGVFQKHGFFSYN